MNAPRHIEHALRALTLMFMAENTIAETGSTTGGTFHLDPAVPWELIQSGIHYYF